MADEGFETLAERYRGELRVHCYRMLGSFDEAEDLVQETFLRAWKNLDGFEGRSSLRAWLYKIATNACLDTLDGKARRVLPQDLTAPSDPSVGLPARYDIPWLQPFPDSLLVEEQVVAKETVELAFLAAIQYLPPRQRAVLILRDVLGWPAKDVAGLLDGSVASVNSALQRARETMRAQLPERRLDWAPSAEPTSEERAILRRYMAAMERADLAAVAELLAEDVRAAMPPWPMWFRGRSHVVASLRESWDESSPSYIGRFRMLPTRANGRPAVGTYLCRRGDTAYRPFAISVLRLGSDGLIAELTAFHEVRLFEAFGLPDEFPGAAPSHGA
jgi:RNA polymerase sigma-70 factor, ECF subfamily